MDGQVLAAGETHDVAANPRLTAVAKVLGYTVLSVPERRIGVPPGGFTLGSGVVQFSMTVDRIVDLVGSAEIVGKVGDTVVRIPYGSAGSKPRAGDRVMVHATQFSELD